MKNPKISVIIPVYNIEAYIAQCIESVINQTYKKLEIILVDDGSTDSSGDICDKYASQDNRISVIHKKNGGLSDARNVAIDKASGNYILFIDGDDYIHHYTIEVLVSTARQYNSEVTTCGYSYVFDDSIVDLSEALEKSQPLVFTVEMAIENLMYQKNTTTSAWGKLYKKELFSSGVRYPKSAICEDLPTTYKLFAKANTLAILSNPLYLYRQRKGSIIQSSFKPNRLQALDFAKDQLAFIQDSFPGIESAAINRLFMEAVFILQTITLNKAKQFPDAWDACIAVIKKYRHCVLRDGKSKKIYRLYALLSYISPSLTLTLNNVKSKLRI